jgi:hypothetical protein
VFGLEKIGRDETEPVKDESNGGTEHENRHAIKEGAVVTARYSDEHAECDGYYDSNYRFEHSPFLCLGRILLGAPLILINNAKPEPSDSFGLILLQIQSGNAS